MNCPYSSEELDHWDGVSNPMGEACNECGEWECEHNPNGDPAENWFDDPMEATVPPNPKVVVLEPGQPIPEGFEPLGWWP